MFSGYLTGAIYPDKYLQAHGFPGQSVQNGSVIVIKTHWGSEDVAYDRAVVLVRNPYDNLLGDIRFIAGGHYGDVKKELFKHQGTFTDKLNLETDKHNDKNKNLIILLMDHSAR